MSLIILSDDNSNSNELPEISFPCSQLSRNSLNSDDIFDQLSKHTNSLTKRIDSGISSGGSTIDLERSCSGPSTASTSCKNSSSSGLSKGKRKKSDGAIKKSAKLLEQGKKRNLGIDKGLRCEAVEKNKKIKTGECMNYVTVKIHPDLGSKWYMINVLDELDAAGVHVSLNEDQDPDLVLWSGQEPGIDANIDQACGARSLYVMEARAVAQAVRAGALARRARIKAPRTALTVVLFGIKDYFVSCKKNNHVGEKITQVELELAITDMIVWAGCDAIIINTSNELALFIKQFTKAIAEAPLKIANRVYDDQANFYTKGFNKQCVSVDKEGNGLKNLWQQMIAVLPQSSLVTARALCGKYASPLILCEALKSPDSVNKLANMSVSAATVPSSKSRRLGQEFARRLKILFTAEDGNILLD